MTCAQVKEIQVEISQSKRTQIMMATTQTDGLGNAIDSTPINTTSDIGQESSTPISVTKGMEQTTETKDEEEADFLSHVPLEVTELDLNHERLTSLRSLRLERFTHLRVCLFCKLYVYRARISFNDPSPPPSRVSA